MEHRAIIESTTVQAVQQLLSQHAFLEAFAKEVGVTSGEIDISEADDAVEAQMPWSFRTDKAGIPSLAQKFLPQEVELVWWQEWKAEEPLGDIRVELHGHPAATCTGRASLAQSGQDVEYVVITETKTNGVPWPLGGKVESMINKDLVGWILSVQARVANREV
ncbi:MAG: DUF2505 domain-containing protein [Candidatus Nanopelagicales bacterium]|jgi:hypothetical protein|nr:DUF2505 domain-containing protein [Candidatus Nanopelagicales bacterium]